MIGLRKINLNLKKNQKKRVFDKKIYSLCFLNKKLM